MKKLHSERSNVSRPSATPCPKPTWSTRTPCRFIASSAAVARRARGTAQAFCYDGPVRLWTGTAVAGTGSSLKLTGHGRSGNVCSSEVLCKEKAGRCGLCDLDHQTFRSVERQKGLRGKPHPLARGLRCVSLPNVGLTQPKGHDHADQQVAGRKPAVQGRQILRQESQRLWQQVGQQVSRQSQQKRRQ